MIATVPVYYLFVSSHMQYANSSKYSGYTDLCQNENKKKSELTSNHSVMCGSINYDYGSTLWKIMDVKRFIEAN